MGDGEDEEWGEDGEEGEAVEVVEEEEGNVGRMVGMGSGLNAHRAPSSVCVVILWPSHEESK